MNQVLLSKFGADRPGLAALQAGITACYTCSSCASECPVNRMTDRLHPVRIVRMAAFGLFDELIRLPEIWYCLQCRRCKHICPMTVKPSVLIDYLRRKAVRQGVVPRDTAQRVKSLVRQLHRVRRRAVMSAIEGQPMPDVARKWHETAQEPGNGSTPAAPVELHSGANSFKRSCALYLDFPTNLSSCYTCSECSNSCPVFFERNVFDPLWIFRMAAFGLSQELLSAPSIWLCLECRSCTEACGQRVRGHLVIRRIRELAVERGLVGREFQAHWRDMEKEIYQHFLKKVDAVSGFHLEG